MAEALIKSNKLLTEFPLCLLQVTEEVRAFREPKETRVRGDHVDLQVCLYINVCKTNKFGVTCKIENLDKNS